MNSSFLKALTVLIMTVAAAQSQQKGPAMGNLVQSSQDDRARLAGTWRYATSDANTSQKITLTLRSDGTYSKMLDARVNGASYGGTHDGTWTARGMVVSLSGDGNWPALTHDLSSFTKD